MESQLACFIDATNFCPPHASYKYITNDLKLTNSFDTWHGMKLVELTPKLPNFYTKGTKNVAKVMKKISEGRLSDKCKTWFPEFRDKSSLNFIHVQV